MNVCKLCQAIGQRKGRIGQPSRGTATRRVLGDDSAQSGAAIARLTELSRYVDDVANLTPNLGQPFVGRSAFAHKGGMHAHAMQVSLATCEHVTCEHVTSRTARARDAARAVVV